MNANEIKKLATRCSAHLQREEAVLQETLRIVEETREGLLARDGERLERSVTEQQKTFEAAEAIRVRREAMRKEIAALLDLTLEKATITRLAEKSPIAVGNELRNSRTRLSKLVARVRTMHRTNAVLAIQTNRIVANALHKLIGLDMENASYAKNGKQPLPAAPAVVDTDT